MQASKSRRAKADRGGQMNGGGGQLTTGARERGRGSTCKESEGESARVRECEREEECAGMLVCMRVQMQAGLRVGKVVDVGS